MKKILEINNLLFRWNKNDDFYLKIKSFSVERNKKIVLFGKSGVGKSTLLNLISGILEPESGSIKINNTIVNKLSQTKKDNFRANNIGVIFQQFNILDYISPLKNILLPCYFTGFKKEDSNFFYERAHSLAEKLNLNKKILTQEKSKELSVGQIQRISIIRSIINKPKLILADEPTSALDNINKKKFLDMLFNICNIEKITILMVSHDTSLRKSFDTTLHLEEILKKNENII